MGLGRRLAPWLLLPSLLIAVSGSIGLGLGVPAADALGELPGAADLDYSHDATPYVPLTSRFIAKELGLPRPVATPSVRTGTSTPPAPVPAVAGPRDVDAGREVASPTANDSVATAFVVPGVPFAGRSQAASASRDPDEPESCGDGPATVWYRYVPSVSDHFNGAVQAERGQVSLAAFSGTPGSFRLLSCRSGLLGATRTSASAVAGEPLWFQVATERNAGEVTFTLDPAGTTHRVSTSMNGGDADSVTNHADISADGRFIVFESWASDIVPNDTNETVDVFVLDRETGMKELVSVASDGTQGNGNSGTGMSTISADGRFVAFYSFATNLVPDDTNGWSDVFVHDRLTGETTRVSVASDGSQGVPPGVPSTKHVQEAGCPVIGGRPPATDAQDPLLRYNPFLTTGVNCSWRERVSLSADGRRVAFDTHLAGLDGDGEALDAVAVGLAPNARMQVYVHDRSSGTTEVVSIEPDGQRMPNASYPSLSADGRVVAFTRETVDEIQSDVPATAGDALVYVRDLRTGVTELVSRSTDGTPANAPASFPDLSADGRWISFETSADNLVDGDTNAESDVYVHDRSSGSTVRASVSSSGAQAEFSSWTSSISGDGRYVSFDSPGSFATGSTTTGLVYVRDLVTRTTTLVSVSDSGAATNRAAGWSRISEDGRHVAFITLASNLADDDHNGPDDGLPVRHAYALYGFDAYVHTLGAAQ